MYILYQSVQKTFCDTHINIVSECPKTFCDTNTCICMRVSQKHSVIHIHVYILNQSVPKHSVIHKHVYVESEFSKNIESECPKSIL